MIKLTFVIGGALRKVYINSRKMTFISAELNFEPIIIDLDKLDEIEDKIKKLNLGQEDIDQIKELSLLNNEESMARDITKDFQRSGWRLTNKEIQKKDGSD